MAPATGTLEQRPEGWVNLLIESVEVPLDSDGSLLFSTVQSLIPGAHGLYFRDGQARKALSLDATTGRVLSPLGGWTANDIYVHLAHGHRHGVNCQYTGEYTKASEIFERNLTAAKKIAVKPKSGFEAQAEDSESSTRQRLAEKEKLLEEANAEKEILAQRLKDAEAKIIEQQTENEELRNRLDTAFSSPAIETAISPEPQQTGDRKKQGRKGKYDDTLEAQITQLKAELDKEKQKCHELTAQLATSFNEPEASQRCISKLQAELDAAYKKCAEFEAQAESLQTELWSEREQHDFKVQELIEKEEEMNNLHNLIAELRKKLAQALREKAELESHLGSAQEKVSVLEQMGPKHDKANERIVFLDSTVASLQLQLTEAREKLSQQASKEDLIARLYEEKDKLQWKIGELTQWWNDSKWKIGELEASVEKYKQQLEEANAKFSKLIEDTRNIVPAELNEAIAQPGAQATFAVSRPGNSNRCAPPNAANFQPYPAFYAPPMPMYYPNFGFPVAQSNPTEEKRVLFEIDAPDAKTVFLAGSFLNWEVALLCRPLGNGKHGVWVNVPRGRYDFKYSLVRLWPTQYRFLVDGEWRASSLYTIAHNEFGSMNNSRTIE